MKHYNPSITERANRVFNLKSGDQMSDEIDGPVATIPIIPSCKIVRTANATNASSATIFTTPADRDFYLVAASLSYIKDITATSTVQSLNVIVDGVTTAVIALAGITLTPAADSLSFVLPFPLKIDRNTAITITNSQNVANIRTHGVIIGYYEEVTRT
jgi:hypothetical protein